MYHGEGGKRENRKSKNMNKYNRLSSLEFSKLHLAAEVKILTISDAVLYICRENFKTFISKGVWVCKGKWGLH